MTDTNNDCVWTFQGYELDKGNFTTAMVHLYRAEVTRANLWRNRLDTTTNWAVITTGAALTFGFSSAQNPHFVLLLVLILTLTFLLMEARRYSYYALWYHRVRLLETEFFATMIAPPYHPSADWGSALQETLLKPTFLIPRWKAIGIRYRRNYIWLTSLLIISWFLKLSIHPEPAGSAQEIIQRAAISALVAGPWVVGVVVFTYVALLVLMVVATVSQSRPVAEQPKNRRGPILASPTFQERLAIIITNQPEAISEQLMKELQRGVTALNATGMYTGENRHVLLCAVTRPQIKQLDAIVRRVDPQAFTIVVEASDIHGRGFRPTEPPS